MWIVERCACFSGILDEGLSEIAYSAAESKKWLQV